jgi:hypothetical protein
MGVVLPREVPLTREHMFAWVQGWKKAKNLGNMPPLEDYIRGKLEEELGDMEIQIPAPEGSAFTTVSAIDYIMDDLPSYLPPDPDGE